MDKMNTTVGIIHASWAKSRGQPRRPCFFNWVLVFVKRRRVIYWWSPSVEAGRRIGLASLLSCKRAVGYSLVVGLGDNVVFTFTAAWGGGHGTSAGGLLGSTGGARTGASLDVVFGRRRRRRCVGGSALGHVGRRVEFEVGAAALAHLALLQTLLHFAEAGLEGSKLHCITVDLGSSERAEGWLALALDVGS